MSAFTHCCHCSDVILITQYSCKPQLTRMHYTKHNCNISCKFVVILWNSIEVRFQFLWYELKSLEGGVILLIRQLNLRYYGKHQCVSVVCLKYVAENFNLKRFYRFIRTSHCVKTAVRTCWVLCCDIISLCRCFFVKLIFIRYF